MPGGDNVADNSVVADGGLQEALALRHRVCHVSIHDCQASTGVSDVSAPTGPKCVGIRDAAVQAILIDWRHADAELLAAAGGLHERLGRCLRHFAGAADHRTVASASTASAADGARARGTATSKSSRSSVASMPAHQPPVLHLWPPRGALHSPLLDGTTVVVARHSECAWLSSPLSADTPRSNRSRTLLPPAPCYSSPPGVRVPAHVHADLELASKGTGQGQAQAASSGVANEEVLVTVVGGDSEAVGVGASTAATDAPLVPSAAAAMHDVLALAVAHPPTALVLPQNHPALVEGMVHEGLHVAVYESQTADQREVQASRLRAREALEARGAMVMRLRALVRQRHAWSVRADWLGSVALAAIRRRHYDQHRAVFGRDDGANLVGYLTESDPLRTEAVAIKAGLMERMQQLGLQSGFAKLEAEEMVRNALAHPSKALSNQTQASRWTALAHQSTNEHAHHDR